MKTSISQIALGFVLLASPACAGRVSAMPARAGSSETSFDRNLAVSGQIRVEIYSGSGDVRVTSGANGAVHVHGTVHSSWSIFGSDDTRVRQIAANPPIEQRGDTIRIGKGTSGISNLSISYVIEVPHDTEVLLSAASGSVSISGVRGPLKVESSSGSVHVEKIDRDTTIASSSGSVSASDLSGYLRASTSSGSITVSNVKEDVRVESSSGSIEVHDPHARIEAQSRSGSVQIYGVTTDAKAHSQSGNLTLSGDPGKSGYWKLESSSGSVDVGVRPNSAFFFSAESSSGAIHTDIPIVIEEQGKHSLRAHVGNGGGRVEVRSASGSINVRSAS
ncbi:MAG TPA: DUF4097 family beta strand repeat-containing protein [Candidatus Dormibacteraeota bacterium]|nr:DUF4097 family beta strand repeat-containing protein [Candidatus Dormibacteraeota bacterium]